MFSVPVHDERALHHGETRVGRGANVNKHLTMPYTPIPYIYNYELN